MARVFRLDPRWWGLLPGLLMLGLVALRAEDVPLIDEWIAPGQFLVDDARGEADLQGLTAQFMDARLITLRLVNAAITRAVGWRSSVVMILNALCQVGVIACLISALPKRDPPRRRAFVALVIAAMFMAPIKAYCYFWALQFSVGLLNLCLALGLFVAPRLSLRWRWLVLVGLAIIATSSFASGLMLWPLFVLPLCLGEEGRRRRVALAAYAVVAAGVFLAFFTDYTRSGPPVGERLADPVLIARFFLAWLGHPFSLEGGLALSQVFGALALFGTVWLARAAFMTLRSTPERRREVASWLALLVFILATAALVALGRAHRGLDEAVRARYLDHALWFPVALVGLAASLGQARRSRLIVFALAGLFAVAAWTHGLIIFDRHARYGVQNRLTLDLIDALPENPALERIHSAARFT